MRPGLFLWLHATSAFLAGQTNRMIQSSACRQAIRPGLFFTVILCYTGCMEKRRVAVRTMIEQVMVSGDLVFDASAQRMLDGIRGHQALQHVPHPDALNEVPVQLTVETDEVSLTVHGRIDRLYGCTRVEEIKTIYRAVATEKQIDPQHRMQAICYAHMLCVSQGLPGIEVAVTYLNLGTGEVTSFPKFYPSEELKTAFDSVVTAYLVRLLGQIRHAQTLRDALQRAVFPYPAYRKGQRELAQQVYWTVKEKQTLLVSAPTGTGKTMAVLFPALKAVGEGLTDRLFYLTARTTQQQAAIDAVRLLAIPQLRAVVITAREKACVFDTPVCKHAPCLRAEGYYDRLSDAIADFNSGNGIYDRERIRKIADAHLLCPFELALDLALMADVIICDYNYAFDPRVRLQRFFLQGQRRQTLLIDEAHNLPDRGRDMYSASLSLKLIADTRKSVPKPLRKGAFYRRLTALIHAIRDCFIDDDAPRACREAPTALLKEAEKTLPLLRGEDVPADSALARELLFALSAFVFAGESYTEDYVTLLDGGKTTRRVALFCTDSAKQLAATYRTCMGAVLFSATLSPFSFYRALCGLQDDAPMLDLPSPFYAEQLLVLHARISTRYQDRERTLPAVAAHIAAFVTRRARGNYLIYLPSHAYLHALSEQLIPLLTHARVLCQSARMPDEERTAFLEQFSPDPTGITVGLAVLGGVFSEGVDLPAERLCGAAIVGVGLPQLGLERSTLQLAYEDKYGCGYDYAYRFPGMCRVLQAAGRIIRTETDLGALLLIDDRYDEPGYRALIPPLWQVTRVKNTTDIAARCSVFWDESSE